jgi:cell division protein FtsL
VATARKEQAAASGVLRSPALPVLLTLAALAIGVAALLPLIQSSSATSTAGEVRTLEVERNDMRARLRALELEVAQMGSLSRIEQEAAVRFEMGAAKQQHYIAVDAPAPEPRRIPSRYLPEPAEAQSDSSSLLEDVIDWMIP